MLVSLHVTNETHHFIFLLMSGSGSCSIRISLLVISELPGIYMLKYRELMQTKIIIISLSKKRREIKINFINIDSQTTMKDR